MKSVLTEHGGFHVLVEMDTYFVALTPTTMDTGVAFSVRAATPSLVRTDPQPYFP